MKSITKVLALASVVAVMSLGAGQAMAQGRGGNFDPAQFKQMRLDRLKEQMAVTDDAEWKVIETAAGKVMDAQMDAMSGRFGGMRRGRGGNNNTATDNSGTGGGGTTARTGRPGSSSPEMEALQKAVDDNASADVINAKLKAVHDANKAKEDKLEQTQADFRKILTPRQEAIAVLNGLLK